MRKYKVTVEAEIEIPDYLDKLDILEFNKNQSISKLINKKDTYESNYKLYLDLYETNFGEEVAIADITNIKVENILQTN